MAVGIGLAAPTPPRLRRGYEGAVGGKPAQFGRGPEDSDLGPADYFSISWAKTPALASTPGSGWSPRVRRTVASRAATAEHARPEHRRRRASCRGTFDSEFVALGFGPALVPRSAAITRPDDVAAVELADPVARHPISLVHRHPAPTAPSARAFLALLAAFRTQQ